jgi:hypothetical protein
MSHPCPTTYVTLTTRLRNKIFYLELFLGKGGIGHDWRDHKDYWTESVGYRGKGRDGAEEEEEEEGGT